MARTSRSLIPLLLTVIAGGCAPTPEPAPGPPAPEVVWTGDGVEATVERLIEGPVAFAAALPGWRLVAQVEGKLLELGPLDPEPLDHGTAVGGISAVAPLDGGGALLSGTGGLFTLHAWGLAPSPLGDVYSPDGSEQLLSAPGDVASDLWIASTEGLSLWRDGGLYSVSAGDLPTTAARLAWGSPVQDNGALWVAADGLVYALVEQGDGFVTWEEAGALAALDLAVDGVDDLWVAVSGAGDPAAGLPGDVRRRLPDATWQWFRLPGPAGTFATARTGAVWVAEARQGGAERALYHQRLDTWTEVVVDGAPALSDDDRVVGADDTGRLLVRGPNGLRRVSLARSIVVLGLEDGAILEEPVSLSLIPTLASSASTMSVTLDGVPQTVTFLDLGPGAGAWQVSIDPITLDDGAHELSATVTWDDGHDPVDQAVFFSVGAFVPPTWTEDIEPLNAAYCGDCHTSNGGAHLLDTRERWRAEVEGILANTISGAMPLSGDKLDADQIRRIELWRAGDFQE